MMRFSKIWYCVVVMAVLILAAGITTLFPQTNDVPVSEETKPLDTPNKVDSVTKVEPQQEVPASSFPDVNIDPSDKVALQQLFNDLRKEYLDTRDGAINWWLQFITTVLAFFGIVVVVLGYFGIKIFRELEADAKKYVEEIREHLAQSEAHLRHMSSIDFGDPEKAPEVEKAIRDVQSESQPSFIDKVLTEIYALQRNGRVEDAVEKWRSIANISEGTDNNLASRAWLSMAYFLPEGDDQLAAYNKAMNLNPDYTRVSRNQPISKHSRLFHEGIVVNAVVHYFNEPKFEKFSTAREYIIGSSRSRADVVLHDEEGRLAVIVECKRIGYVGREGIVQLAEYCRHGDVQFGIFATDIDPSKWTFLRIRENEIIEIRRSEFETEVVGSGSS